MSSYWAEFAYGSSPDTGRDGTYPAWQAWDASTGGDKFIIFDTEAGGGIRMDNTVTTMLVLRQQLLEDAKLFDDQKQLCGLYVHLFFGTDLWDADQYAQLGSCGCGDYPPGSFVTNDY